MIIAKKTMSEIKSWINTPRQYDLEIMNNNSGQYVKNLKLTDNYEQDVNPPGFKTNLLPHQKTTVKAMRDLERVKYIKISNTAFVSKYDSIRQMTSAGVLSDKLGSGKTYDILALCAWDKVEPIPRAPPIMDLPLIRNIPTAPRGRHFKHESVTGSTIEVKRLYKKFLPFTMVFVAKSVLLQWQNSIIKHTGLKVFTISNLQGLKMFYNMIFKPDKKNNINRLSQYDVILIKNGKISGDFSPSELEDTQLDGVKLKSILTIMGELLKNFCVTRVVLDDFDTLGIPTDAHAIPALFTWFVSATKKTIKPSIKYYKAKNVQDAVTNYRPPYVSVWQNRNLFTFFNIGTENDYIDKSTQASQVKFFTYSFKNPNNNFIGLFGQMGTEDAQLVAEALNGDAIMTAACQVGIKSTSVADIFERVLENKWKVYEKAVKISHYITNVRPFVDNLPPKDHDTRSYGDKTLGGFRKNLKNPGPFSVVESSINHYENCLTTIIEDVETENNEQKEDSGKAIQRVKDNLKEGECPITAEPLSECDGVVIMKCCGITISTEAASYSLKLHKAKGDASNIAGNCPNCRRTIGFSQLILIDKDIDLEKIMSDDLEIEPVVEPESVDESELEDFLKDDEDDEDLTKFTAIVKCISGTLNSVPEIDEIRKERTDIFIPNMLVGKTDKGEPTDKKCLVYANYGETLDRLQEVLDRKDITFLKLQGTPKQIQDMVHRYGLPSSNPESISVLLINGPEYCAGLNLQMTTDLIFTHKIIDRNIESQVGGRAARYGRTANLRVHYFLYENEFEMFK